MFSTLDADNSLDLLKRAISKHGKPEIINSDQRSQVTCPEWLSYLDKQKIKISKDGKGRAIDNIFIERLWWTVKQEVGSKHSFFRF